MTFSTTKLTRSQSTRLLCLGCNATVITRVHLKPQNKDELKTVLKNIWDDIPQQSIQKSLLTFRKRLQLSIEADGRHIEHLL